MPDEEWLIGMLALAQGTSLLGADDKIPSRPLLEVRLSEGHDGDGQGLPR
jgi:hypothetical protein